MDLKLAHTASRLLAGDVTIDLHGGLILDYGYVVGGKTQGIKLHGPYFPVLWIHVYEWLADKEGIVGSWLSPEGILYIDNNDLLNDFDSAMALARERKEISIYCIHENKVYETGIVDR